MAPKASSIPPDQFLGLLPNHLLGQQALKQGKRLQWLSQIMAGRREKARLGDARQFRLSLGGGERLRRAPPFGYVFVGDNDAFGLLVVGAVGHDPAREPVTALSLDFALKGRLTPEDCFGVIQRERRRPQAT